MRKLVLALALCTTAGAVTLAAYFFTRHGSVAGTAQATPTLSAPRLAAAPRPREHAKREKLTSEFRGLYITSWTAGIKRFRQLVDDVHNSGLNGAVIDVKDCTGKVGYDSQLPLVAEIGSHERRIRNLDEILSYCRERNLHTVARIAVFQDPVLAKARPELAITDRTGGAWKDRKGLSWVDPAARFVWEYNVAVAKEAAARGFDEVQFDYVRFPTDGKLKTLCYPAYKGDVPKHQIIKNFFEYVDSELKPVDVLVSADIFGLTVLAEDDLNIGQRIEDVADHVDYVCPMIYPSHFPTGHLGLKNPADHPYRVIFDSCIRGLSRLEGKRAKMRPWLQDFKLGAAYDKKMILDQLQAARDAKVFGFCMWNARNVYTMEAYANPLPAPNPKPPLLQTVVGQIERQKQAVAQAKQQRASQAAGVKTAVTDPAARRVKNHKARDRG